MARSLPLGPTDATPDEPSIDAGQTLAGIVHVFDPAMCCPTGLCGPGVDPALLTISRDLRWLAKHGATVERSGLAQEPDAFIAQPRVAGLMQAFGDQALPAVLVNGEVLCHGRYPSRDELLAALAPATPAAPAAPTP